jgi:hypothetical protein
VLSSTTCNPPGYRAFSDYYCLSPTCWVFSITSPFLLRTYSTPPDPHSRCCQQVVSMNISAGRIAEAIAVLSNAPIERVLGLIYKTAPVLIAVEPEATVHMLLSKPQLSVAGLLPALLAYCSALDAQQAQGQVR